MKLPTKLAKSHIFVLNEYAQSGYLGAKLQEYFYCYNSLYYSERHLHSTNTNPAKTLLKPTLCASVVLSVRPCVLGDRWVPGLAPLGWQTTAAGPCVPRPAGRNRGNRPTNTETESHPGYSS